MTYTVLIADDDKEIVDICDMFLSNAGYSTIIAYDGNEVMQKFNSNKVDLVVLDIMMPHINGLNILKEIRGQSNVLVLFLTAKSADYDKIIGLKSGADDYMTKPFNPLELAARVEALLRRSNFNVSSLLENDTLVNKDIVMTVSECTVSIAGKKIELTCTEYNLLKFFLENPNRVYTKKQLYEVIRDDEYLNDDNVIMVHISNLRNKIESNTKNPEYIKTIKGIGYKMVKY